jgi:50S ribosomal protein L16 3-hydroxylase
MARHWQKRPLLVRQALPGPLPTIGIDEVLTLGGEGTAQARLVSHKAGQWRVSHGPHERLPSLRTPRWTLLVNGVDRHLDEAHHLLQSFRFLPDARIDDLMISVASDGGGVGPHLDSYDVFLLQARGRRRWRIAPPRAWTMVEGAPLKLIADFEATEEWELDAGDMLYMPPGWAHEGTAIGPCMTCSIGARAPSRQEFLAALLAELADEPGGANPRFRDPGRQASAHPAALPVDLVEQLLEWAREWRPGQAQIERFVGRWMTEPAAEVWFDPSPRPVTMSALIRQAARQGLRLDRATRMAWRGTQIYINGEHLRVASADRALLRQLADDRELDGLRLSALAAQTPVWTLLLAWVNQGWAHVGRLKTS